MSLVVAQATDQGPRIVSDTRVMFPDGTRSTLKTGTLKAIVLSTNLTICFAGDVGTGLDAVRAFSNGIARGIPVQGLIQHLAHVTSDARTQVEFMIATGTGDNQLTRIRDGNVEVRLGAAWLGDDAAFERFQQERHKFHTSERSQIFGDLPEPHRVMNELQQAMRAVIDDPSVPSVDDFCVSVIFRPNGFNYLESFFVYLERDVTVRDGEDLLNAFALSVEDGGYAVSVVQPAHPGTPALGLNFARANLDLLYLPLVFNGAKIIQGVSPNDFAKVVLQRFAIALSDPMFRQI